VSQVITISPFAVMVDASQNLEKGNKNGGKKKKKKKNGLPSDTTPAPTSAPKPNTAAVLWKKSETAQVHYGKELFESYYEKQCIVKAEGDLASFINTLQSPLPITFRLHSSHPEAKEFVKKILELRLPKNEKVTVSGSKA